MEGVIDTNIVVASLLEDDVNHREARRILAELEQWYIPSLVFHEFVWFLKETRLKLELAMPFLRHPKTEIVGITSDDLQFALKSTRKKPRMYNDFVIMSVALRLKKPLITFDEELKMEFRQRGKR